ncbi:Hypothetical protein NTJ_07457 [Nesidiocoris tenuis]|uniref:Uncharacterized protein n=1 Tax=Nesidiocoris tenuis TaxID=355587 RepID=A0ABN7AR06_9HEMI|nr:Hypothetical protein NTJ_07457 [Nesidiocoris tenuis]
MEVAPLGNSNVIKESSSSQQSSVSEFEKDIGNAHVIHKAASFEAEESQKMVSESVNQSISQSVTQSLNDSLEQQTSAENHASDATSDAVQDKNGDIRVQGEQKAEDEVDKVTELAKVKLAMTDRQTSTTSLDDNQWDSNAEVLLSLLEGSGRGEVGTRPRSLPANLAHLWQCLKVTALSLVQSLPFSSSLTLPLFASAM